MAKLHAHMIISGRVQGVGFRFTTLQLADKYGITGWVRNLPDSTVEIEAEGKAEQLYQFIDQIKAGPSRVAKVRNVELSISDQLINYRTFNLKH
ncbi:acylphosphatase [Amphibacillus xylanus]|uniref:acylphosphatase n=1 Tax=Amphibacillus xylanus (strain ATCC 51415 / DSM 6626 / JCM 7361 / LMG 17667 / NBRC 15112 / Ep01) TaxID=698758 RepID=K0IY43_AMPXN|nr:acylphosphatase [Amphibacillus xylanus]BAM47425.1 acylphosphatase [Amphibacillus xylanus NBRC 15112]